MHTDGTNSWITTKTYDELSRLINQQDPGSMTNTYAYNNAGLVEESTDPNGTQFNFTYDSQDRLLTSTGTASSTSSSYAYTYEATPYGIHSIQKDSDPAISYSYNTFGLVQNITHNGHQINYCYDTAGRISATGINGGNWSLNKYNKDRLEKIQTDGSLTPNNSASVNAVYNYNPDGMLESVTYPNNGSNIIKASYIYNGLNRLISVTNSKDGTPFSRYTYTYDNNGNITSASDLNGTTNYEYDMLNRLIKVIKNGTITQEYTYDARGNRENQTGAVPGTSRNETLSYNLWDQLVSAENSTGTTTFEYSPTGLRVKKGNQRYIYDANGNLAAEADASNNITATYIWGGDRLLVKKLADGTQYYYLYNGHGDVVQITDTAGNIVNNYEYDEWGNILTQTETIANDFKYAGEIYDSETGFYYLRARYYDPTVGRFISQDSSEGQITNPLSRNLYTYCVNNPIKYVDPSGYVPVIPILIAVGVYFGETAIETAPDYGLAVATNKFRGEKTNHVATFAEEYVWNLVPGAGEIRTGKQVTGFAIAGIKYGADSAKFGKKGPGKAALKSFDDISANPKALWGKSADEVGEMLGEGWTRGAYGSEKTGWKFTKGDQSVFYHPGEGRHVGSYYGFSSGKLGKNKIVGPDYKPLPGDKATIFQIGK